MARSRPFAAAAGTAAWAIAIGAAAVVVYAGALRYSFSQDDYAWLARAGGQFPRLGGPWRWLSQEAFFDAWRALFALDARAYHAASLVACAAGAILLFALLRRWVAAPAAAVGAAFFATHPAVYTAVYWISALGDLLALDFALATALLAFRRDAWRWAAVPAFALSLVSKESTLLLPLFLLLARPRAKRTAAPEPVVAVLVGLAAGYGTWLVAFGGSGAPAGSGSAAPYAIALGPHVGTNLLTYAGWGIDMLVPFVTGFTDAIDPPVFAWGAALIAAWLIGCASAGLRRRGWRLAGSYALLL